MTAPTTKPSSTSTSKPSPSTKTSAPSDDILKMRR
jgi:hypothetical protein